MGMEIFTTSGVFFSEQYGLKDGDVLQILCVGGGGGGGRGGSGAPGSGGRGGSGGGAGGGVSITPVAMLVIQGGSVKVLQIQSYVSTADRVVGMVPDVIDRVSGFVSGMGKKDSPAPEPPVSPE